VDYEPFALSHKVLTALAAENATPALEWCATQRSRLAKMGSPLEGMLHLQQMIELIREGRRVDAIRHAREHLTGLPEERATAELLTEVRHAMGLLVMGPAARAFANHARLLAPSRWDSLASHFTRDHLTLLGITQVPALEVALSAGMAALKTPCCSLMDQATLNCPTCCEPIRALATAVPSAQRSHSSLVCRVLGEPIDEDNPPLVLPSGQVYSERSLRRFAAGEAGGVTAGAAAGVSGDGEWVVDPITREVVALADVRRAFFL